MDDAERTVIQQVPAGDRRAGARQNWAWYLVFREAGDPAAPRARHLIDHKPVRIGRREPCDLQLRDTEVSGLHCQVQVRDGQLQVVDLGSTNGSFVNGLRVEGTASLPSGATLQVGRQFLRVELRDRLELAPARQDADGAVQCPAVGGVNLGDGGAGPAHPHRRRRSTSAGAAGAADLMVGAAFR